MDEQKVDGSGMDSYTQDMSKVCLKEQQHISITIKHSFVFCLITRTKRLTKTSILSLLLIRYLCVSLVHQPERVKHHIEFSSMQLHMAVTMQP